MASLRFNAVEEAYKKQALQPTAPEALTSEYYGKYVFGDTAMS